MPGPRGKVTLSPVAPYFQRTRETSGVEVNCPDQPRPWAALGRESPWSQGVALEERGSCRELWTQSGSFQEGSLVPQRWVEPDGGMEVRLGELGQTPHLVSWTPPLKARVGAAHATL